MRNVVSSISTVDRQHIHEVAAILAAGYLRTRGLTVECMHTKHTSADSRTGDLTSLRDQSVHAVKPVRRSHDVAHA